MTAVCRCPAETIKRGCNSGRRAACRACSSSRAAGRDAATLSTPACRQVSQMAAAGKPATLFRGGDGPSVSGFLMPNRGQSPLFSVAVVFILQGLMRPRAVSFCPINRSAVPSGRLSSRAVLASICGRAFTALYCAACISAAVSGRARPWATITAVGTSSAMPLHAQISGSSIMARICAAFSFCTISGRSTTRPQVGAAITVGGVLAASPHAAARGSLERSITKVEYVMPQ